MAADGGLAERMTAALRGRRVKLMEVCGSHTVAIARSGLRSLLPAGVRLVSGPGCPVCVTPSGYIERAIGIARRDDCVAVTFGDLLRAPGAGGSLEDARVLGARVKTVYSPREALALARREPAKRVVLLAVGFETTQPGIAAAARAARREGLANFFILSALRLVPPALAALAGDAANAIDGYVLPGHVSAVLGTGPYKFLAERFGRPGVVAGFEAGAVLRAVARLCELIGEGRAAIENQYEGVVRAEGNPAARELTAGVFAAEDAEWRGLGVIAGSGLTPRDEYSDMDAGNLEVDLPAGPGARSGCRCGEVLKGVLDPAECGLFGKACTPERPAGPCMVSSEGSCAAYYRYGGGDGAGD